MSGLHMKGVAAYNTCVSNSNMEETFCTKQMEK
jgi:hypothetical protein